MQIMANVYSIKREDATLSLKVIQERTLNILSPSFIT